MNRAHCRLVLATGAAGAATDATLAWRLRGSAALPEYLFFGAVGSIVSTSNAVTRRVANRFLLPAYCIGSGAMSYGISIFGAVVASGPSRIGHGATGGPVPRSSDDGPPTEWALATSSRLALLALTSARTLLDKALSG